MIKKWFFLCFIIISSLVQADTLSAEQQVAYTKIVDQQEMKSILLDLPRSDRKGVCLKIMHSKTDPLLSYKGANCLLYNGYGDLSIPFFTAFLYNGNNEKYLNGRMGYDWLHSADWYKVGDDVLSDMTDQKSLYIWVQEKIQQEVLAHPKKYGDQALSQVIKTQFRKHIKENPLSHFDKKTLKDCKNIIFFYDNYSCLFDKKTKKFKQCKESAKQDKTSIACESIQ